MSDEEIEDKFLGLSTLAGLSTSAASELARAVWDIENNFHTIIDYCR
jgi:hypothetical protein